MITKASPTANLLRTPASFTTNGLETMQFGLFSGPNGFVGIVEALKQDDILKVLAEPLLTTISGRPASCNVGGEVAYPQPTGFGNISVAFRPFGTQIDFVPIVLGNGGCRLEVRPRVSEVDYTLGTTINGTSVPGFRVRWADVGVELKFGQTLAIAGLLSQETEQQTKGIPYLMDVPYLGTLFRRTHNKVNEIELLILVRPELVDALDPDQLSACRPGTTSLSPDDCGLYFKGYREVPIPASLVPPVGPVGFHPTQEPVTTPPEMETPTGPAPPDINRAPGQPPREGASPDSARRGPKAGPSSRRTAGTVGSAVTTARREPYSRTDRQAPKSQPPTGQDSSAPGFIGPTGYDVKD